MILGKFQRALSYFPRYRRDLILGYLCVPPTSALGLAVPWLIGHALDTAIDGQVSGGHLALLGLGVISLVALKGLFQFCSRLLLVGVSRRLERDLRSDLFGKLQTLSPAFFSRAATGDLVSRTTADVEAVRLTVGPGLMYLSTTLTMVPTALVLMLLENASLARWVFLPMLLLAVVYGVISPALERASRDTQEATGNLAAAAAEAFSGITVLKIFTREESFLRGLEQLGFTYVAAQMRMARARGKIIASLHALIGLSQLAILLVGSYQIVAGNFTVGEFFTFMEWLMLCLWPLVSIGWMVGTVHRGAAGMQRINEIFTTDPEIVSPDPPQPAAPAAGDLLLEDVTVTYPGGDALRDVSLEIPAGTSLGITGRTGSGKSTLAHLLPRLVDPRDGRVTIGGVDLKDWPLDELRRTVGIVLQDGFLFSDTFRDNLRYARPQASDEALLRAGRSAVLDDELLTAEGLKTMIGERGLTLSGGQRQRATLARTLLQDPPILVLDDCLSAVDASTEARILEQLRQVLRGRTTILISHRVAALQLMERVAVLDEGRLVEIGSPAELRARGGSFADLEQRQRLEEELEQL